MPRYTTLIKSAGLPDSVADLISKLVRKARLRHAEQADVARELISHFQDAAEAGVSAEDAVRLFGDVRTAAKLIRRAKIRRRSMLWRIFWVVRWGIAIFVLFYVCLGIYFVFGTPTVKIDYIAKLNSPAEQIPEEQRAWPHYRKALLVIYPPSNGEEQNRKLDDLFLEGIYQNKTDQVAAELQKILPQLQEIRAAAKLPALGFDSGQNGTFFDPEMSINANPRSVREWILEVHNKHLGSIRNAVDVLLAQGELAALQSDADLAFENIVAVHQISSQLQLERSISTQSSSLTCRIFSIDLAQKILSSHPDLLSTRQLIDLAHLTATPNVAGDIFSIDGEREQFYDEIQRVYTDNGRGNGRITAAFGRSLIDSVIFKFRRREPGDLQALALDALSPALVLSTVGTRKQITDRFEAQFAAANANLKIPVRDADWTYLNQTRHSNQSELEKYKYLPIYFTSLGFLHIQKQVERVLGFRDGLLVAIALELYRREHGSYPTSLDSLVPRFLPSVPADRMDGQPIRYKLDKDSKPVVYSVGADLDDDGGVFPVDSRGKLNISPAIEWNITSQERSESDRNGDWILFPPRPQEPYEEPAPKNPQPKIDDWDGDGLDDQQQALKAIQAATQPSNQPAPQP